MPSIFDGLDEIINSFLGIDETWISGDSRLCYEHKETLLRLCKGVGPQNVNCCKLIDSLFAQVNQTWDTLAPNYPIRPPSTENWRRKKNPKVSSKNLSDEVVLERTIIQETDGNWWNQIPVEQTLLEVRRGKVIDLVHRDGAEGRDFEIIELKTGGGYTPLSATGQVLKYGIVYAFYRSRYRELFNLEPAAELLKSSRITLVVLAPWKFYKPFENCDWLARLEVSLDKALHGFSKGHENTLPKMGFRFQTFPKDFVWSTTKKDSDIETQKKVLWAVHHREAVFGSN